MQRLFSTFPNSWPGLGLLVLRLAAAVAALSLWHMTADLAGTTMWLVRCTLLGASVLLWIGLWTPIAGIVQATIHISSMLLAHRYDSSSVIAAALGMALAMLGPGAWSLDAKFFGRKRIV